MGYYVKYKYILVDNHIKPNSNYDSQFINNKDLDIVNDGSQDESVKIEFAEKIIIRKRRIINYWRKSC